MIVGGEREETGLRDAVKLRYEASSAQDYKKVGEVALSAAIYWQTQIASTPGANLVIHLGYSLFNECHRLISSELNPGQTDTETV